MRYQDIIRQMERSGHWGEAEELRRSLDHSHQSEHDRVRHRDEARDGLSIMSYAGDCAERAFEDMKREERRQEERRLDAIEEADLRQREQEREP